MATERQKGVARELVKNLKRNKPLSASQILLNNGYSVLTTKAGSKAIIANKGVQQELDKLGFSQENAEMVTANILLSSESENRDRLKAADIVFKVKGAYVKEPEQPKTIVNNLFFKPEFRAEVTQFEDKIKEMIRNND